VRVRSKLGVRVSDFFISPKHLASTLKPGDVDGAICVFEAAVQGWMLDHAIALTRPRYKNGRHAGFAILLLVSSYFEAIEPYFPGSTATTSSDKWRAGFRRVFPELAAVSAKNIDRIYGLVRCGLYHSLSAGSEVQIDRAGPPVKIDVDSAGSFRAAEVNPWELLKRVQSHFAGYIADLKDVRNTALRQAFATRYRVVALPLGPGGAPAKSSWP